MYVIINSDYCIIVVNLAELMCHLRHFFGQSIKILGTNCVIFWNNSSFSNIKMMKLIRIVLSTLIGKTSWNLSKSVFSDYCITVVNMAELMCHLRHFFGQSIKILETNCCLNYWVIFSNNSSFSNIKMMKLIRIVLLILIGKTSWDLSKSVFSNYCITVVNMAQ